MENLIRRERTQQEYIHLKKQVDNWLEKRRMKDREGEYRGRQATRLDIIEGVLNSAIDVLREGIAGIDVAEDRDTGIVYQECREYDEALVWLERIWEFFREKYTQRDGETKAAILLEAADEVVWSCYHPVFEILKTCTGKQKAAPLAYLATEYSPAAWQSDKEIPAGLKVGAEVPGLENFIRTLPLGVVRLPPWCINQPWWLIFIAHEVGHHILYDLGKAKVIAEEASRGAEKNQLPEDLIQYWKFWSEEIFADAYSVLMFGEYAIWGLWEIVRASKQAMLQRSIRYPAADVRLYLMIETIRQLKFINLDEPKTDSENKLTKWRSSLKADILNSLEATNLEIGQTFLTYLLTTPLDDLSGSLIHIGEKFQDQAEFNNRSTYWGDHLHQDSLPPPEASLEQARWILAGSLLGWQASNHISNSMARQNQLIKVAANTFWALRKSGPPGKRAGEKILDTQSAQLEGVHLAEQLLKVSRTNIGI
jgi:hypothetical protein